MLFNKNNLLACEIAEGKEGIRPELSCVLFKKDRTIATDSISLIQIINPEGWSKTEGLPVVAGKKPLISFRKEGYLVPSKSVKKVISNLKDSDEDNFDQKCFFVDNNNNDKTLIATTDSETTDLVESKIPDVKYPVEGFNDVIQKSG